MENLFLRRFFRVLNKYFMVPLFRLGIGPLAGNPLTGYIMVIKTKGRKTGKVRHAPVNYAIMNGNVYCLAGFGHVADWYRNVKAQAQIEVILPAGPIWGHAEEVTDADEARIVTRQLLKNAGFAGYFLGFNPHTVSDEILQEKIAGLPVIRIRPVGIGSGAGDPGGWLWVSGFVILACVLLGRRKR